MSIGPDIPDWGSGPSTLSGALVAVAGVAAPLTFGPFSVGGWPYLLTLFKPLTSRGQITYTWRDPNLAGTFVETLNANNGSVALMRHAVIAPTVQLTFNMDGAGTATIYVEQTLEGTPRPLATDYVLLDVSGVIAAAASDTQRIGFHAGPARLLVDGGGNPFTITLNQFTVNGLATTPIYRASAAAGVNLNDALLLPPQAVSYTVTNTGAGPATFRVTVLAALEARL